MQTRVVELIPQLLDEGFTEELLVVNDDLNNAFIRYERYAASNTITATTLHSTALDFYTYRCAIGFQVRQIEQSTGDKRSTGGRTVWDVFAWVAKALNWYIFFLLSHSFRAPLQAQTSWKSALSLHLSTSLLLLQQPVSQQPTPQPNKRNYQTAVSKRRMTPSTVLQWRQWDETCFMKPCWSGCIDFLSCRRGGWVWHVCPDEGKLPGWSEEEVTQHQHVCQALGACTRSKLALTCSPKMNNQCLLNIMFFCFFCYHSFIFMRTCVNHWSSS